MNPNRRRVIKIAAIVLVVMSVALICGELYFRSARVHIIQKHISSIQSASTIEQNPEFLIQYTPNKGRRLIPGAHVIIKNHSSSKRDIEMRINSFGFRGPEVTVEKAKGFTRVLVLGDSITWADYLPEEETWVRFAEKKLQTSGHSFELINAGVGDTGTNEQLDILEEKGLSVHPDIVLVAWYLNDSRPPWGFADELGSRGWIRRHSLLADTAYFNFRLWQWSINNGGARFEWVRFKDAVDWKTDQQVFLDLAYKARFDWGSAWQNDSWEVVKSQMQRLKNLSIKNGFKVAVMALPVNFQVYATYIDDFPQKKMKEIAEGFGFSYADLLPILRGYQKDTLFYDHCHPNILGNEIYGKVAADFLLRVSGI